ncbi:MAG: MG2 domain-containing protein [Marinifilaceae bacterium]
MKKIIFNITLISLVVILFSCNNSPKTTASKIDGFEQYIEGYTDGLISSGESIRIKFKNEVNKGVKEGKEVKKGILSFKPSIKGKAYWHNAKEIEFIPTNRLANSKDYTATLELGELVNVDSSFNEFIFKFSTIKQLFSINEKGLKLYADGKNMKYVTTLLSADFLSSEQAEKIISIDKDLITNWKHSVNGRTHTFVIDSIVKSKESEKIKLSWNGSVCDVDEKGEQLIIIPGKGEFYLIGVQAEKSNEKQFRITFSDAIDKNQDLRGLVQLQGYRNLKFNVSLNELIVYSNTILTGQRRLTVSQGLKSLEGDKLKKNQNLTVKFEEIKPQVKFIGKGVITPSNNGFNVPFSAVSLKAVDVRVIQIYSNNVHQFLQDNRLNNSNGLRKVGKLVLQKKVSLEGSKDLTKWNDYRLNLSDLMKVDKSAIYRIELRFKKAYAIYDCGEKTTKEEVEEVESSYEDWDNPGWYSDYYTPTGYNWRDREDPRTISYYSSNHFKSKNVIASNIGVIAKRGSANNMFVYVSKLTDTKSLKDASIEVFSYQNQLLATAKTDVSGFAELPLKSKAFLIVVSKDGEKAYLRVDDGSALSISNFDVAGAQVQKGLKGFIYGERGVWRPGDNIHVSFILEDKQKSLPNHHPIIAKLYNSRGQLVSKEVQYTSDKGLNCFNFLTEKEAPTGNWNVEIQVGGAHFSKRLKVETIKPNRLKINMSITGKMLKSSVANKLRVESAWLHGAKAPNLRADVVMSLSKARTSFKGYSNYIFDDVSKNFWFNGRTIYNGKTNDTGVLDVPVPISNLTTAPGFLRASFLTRIFEKTGDFSISGKSFVLSPYKSYVGMQLPTSDSDWYQTKKNYKLKLASIDDNGKALNKRVTIELFKIQWRWWWDSNDSNLASYVNRRYNKNVTTQHAQIVNGKGVVNIRAREYGRYYLKITDNESGHSCGKTIYFSSWGGFDVSDMPGGASMLILSLDKVSYNVGDEVVVNIPSSKEGKALISIESGIKVIDKFVIDTKDKKTRFTFKATEEMSPNVYVNVSLLQPHKNTDNDHPMRLYGIIPVTVNNPQTILKPVIKQDKELRPEKEFTVKVKELNSKEMSYTIAIVDEGLLDITSYQTPNPHSAFYAREALGVKTWDMYDYVLGAYGARLESAFAIGGDASLKDKTKKRSNRFKPVVLFKGPFTLKKGEKKTHKFMMPNYIGAVKTMVIASKDGAYGSSSVSSEVKKPLMLLASLPRVLNPGDKIKLPVTLFVMSKKIKDVNLSLEVNDKIKIIGSSKQKVHFGSVGEKIAEFEIEVTDRIGKGEIKIFAKSRGEKASFETDIEVRVPNPPITKIEEKFIEKGMSTIIDVKPIGIKGTNTTALEMSVLPAMNLSNRLETLIHYPHGCLEQTVSGAFPQLYLSKLTNLTDVEKTDVMDNINICISKLMRFQTSDGGFTYWQGGRYISEWANIYAGHFMLMAEKEGYSIPVSMKKKYLRYQKTMANNWNNYSRYYNSELVQAYRLYVLALAGEENIGAMNRMREKSKLPYVSSWRLAAAYAVAGRDKVASKLINNLSTDVKVYREWGHTFGSALRDKSMILETLTAMGKKAEAFKLAIEVTKKLGSNQWMSTQTIAYSLFAMSQYIEKFNQGDSAIKCEYSINGKEESANTNVSILSKKVKSDENLKIEVKNLGDKPIFVRVINKGVPLIYKENVTTDKLRMSVSYKDTEGRTISPDNIKQGKDFVVYIKVSNNSNGERFEQLALTAMFPTGWEIANTRLFDGNSGNKANYIDIRDDRMNFYFSLGYKSVKTFKINLNASYKGEYYLPAISCEAMYNNDVRAVVAGKNVKVN